MSSISAGGSGSARGIIRKMGIAALGKRRAARGAVEQESVVIVAIISKAADLQAAYDLTTCRYYSGRPQRHQGALRCKGQGPGTICAARQGRQPSGVCLPKLSRLGSYVGRVR